MNGNPASAPDCCCGHPEKSHAWTNGAITRTAGCGHSDEIWPSEDAFIARRWCDCIQYHPARPAVSADDLDTLLTVARIYLAAFAPHEAPHEMVSFGEAVNLTRLREITAKFRGPAELELTRAADILDEFGRHDIADELRDMIDPKGDKRARAADATSPTLLELVWQWLGGSNPSGSMPHPYRDHEAQVWKLAEKTMRVRCAKELGAQLGMDMSVQAIQAHFAEPPPGNANAPCDFEPEKHDIRICKVHGGAIDEDSYCMMHGRSWGEEWGCEHDKGKPCVNVCQNRPGA